MNATTTDWTALRAVAAAAAAGLGAIAVFQLAIAAGAPLGRAAWGGVHPGSLPTGLRVASSVAVLVWGTAALIVLRRGGFTLPIPEAVAQVGTWVVVGVLLVGTLANLASSSAWERYFWAPTALVLCILCFVTARGGSGH